MSDQSIQSLHERVAELERRAARVPLREGSGGGGMGAPRQVATLPTIGTKYDVVTWCSVAYLTDGTGDDQVWEVDGRVGQDAWTPRQFVTSLSGTP